MSIPSRRDVLKSSAGLAAGAVLPSLGGVAPAMADSNPMAAADIVAAIKDKKIKAIDVTKAAIARAEQVRDLNALIILVQDNQRVEIPDLFGARDRGLGDVDSLDLLVFDRGDDVGGGHRIGISHGGCNASERRKNGAGSEASRRFQDITARRNGHESILV